MSNIMNKEENDEVVELLWSMTDKLDKVLEQLIQLNRQLAGKAGIPTPDAPEASPPLEG
jgi:hypothetical protein